jgi:predicted transcriptional regulator
MNVKKKNKPHRSRYEIVYEVLLEVLLRNQSPSSLYKCKLLHIEYAARLTYNQTLYYLPSLVEAGLLIRRRTAVSGPFDYYYEITHSGRRYLQVFAELEDNMYHIVSDIKAVMP